MRVWFVLLIIILALQLPGGTMQVQALAEPALTLTIPPPSLQSEVDGSVCYGLDIIFLIDQSSSMSGRPGLSGNDPPPNNDRAIGALHALDWLSSNRLSLCPETVHRIALISFATEAQLDLPFMEISPVTQGDWDQVKTDIEQKIKAYDMGKTEIEKGNTDHLTAFQLAKSTLESLDEHRMNCVKRQ